MVAVREPLRVKDFQNPRFDAQGPFERMIDAYKRNAGGRKEHAIEGVTVTNNRNRIGYTYFPRDDTLYLSYWDEKRKKEVQLLRTHISSRNDFEKALKGADRKIMQYRENKRAA